MAVRGPERAGVNRARAPKHMLNAKAAQPGPRVAHDTHFDTETGQVTTRDYLGEGSHDGEPAVTVSRPVKKVT